MERRKSVVEVEGMAYVMLDDFEEGPDGGSPSPTTLSRRTGSVLDDYPHTYGFNVRHYSGTPPTPALVLYNDGDFGMPGFEGEWRGLILGGHNANLSLVPANSLGFAFCRGDYFPTLLETSLTPTTSKVSRASVTWDDLGLSRTGGVEVDMISGQVTVREWWIDNEDSTSDSVSTVYSIPAPDPGAPGQHVWHEWMELRVGRFGWSLQFASGTVLASGLLPKNPAATFPADGYLYAGLVWSNVSATSTDSRLNPWMGLDAIGGELGLYRIEYGDAEGEPDSVRRTFDP